MTSPDVRQRDAGEARDGRRSPTEDAPRPNANRRFAIGLVAVVLAAGLVATLIDAVLPHPSGPRSSSYATASDGLAGWAELLERSGHPVRALRRAPSDAALGRPPGTIVLLDAPRLPAGEVTALRRFAQRGGTVVVGGADAGPWVADVLGDDSLLPGIDAPREAHVLAPAPETAGVTRVRGAGDASWAHAGGSLPVLGADGHHALLVVRAVGRGRIAALADASPLTNARLDAADNAAFALALARAAGRRSRVTFVESVHGYGAARGLAALPTDLKVALALLALAALTLIVARWPRFGPPEPSSRELPPPRRAYVEALAATLARSRAREPAVAPLRSAAVARLRRRAGLTDDAPPEALQAAAVRLGLDGHEAALLTRDAETDDDLLALGRALAKLGR